jgi:hypothetical protein
MVLNLGCWRFWNVRMLTVASFGASAAFGAAPNANSAPQDDVKRKSKGKSKGESKGKGKTPGFSEPGLQNHRTTFSSRKVLLV